MEMTLKAARTNVGKKVSEAAAEIGVSEKTLRSWENGITCPSGRYILPILQCYNCTFENIRFPIPKTTV